MNTWIKDIEILFSPSQEQYIDKIKTIIQNNYELISKYLGDNKKIDISKNELSFDDFFYNIVKKAYKSDDETKDLFNKKNFLPVLYAELLIRRKSNLGETLVEKNKSISDETLNSFIAYKYYEENGTFNDFVEYLKYRNNEEKIFEWLKKNYRWDTYNYLLSIAADFLESDDKELYDQMKPLTTIVVDKAIDYSEKNKDKFKNISNKKIKEISNKEFDNLFCDFLNYINAPIEWKKDYEHLKENNLIIFDNSRKEYNDSMVFKDDDEIYKILVSDGDTIDGFCSFVHEFIHYVHRCNNESVESVSVSEIPSIFFEKITSLFLKEKGYSSDIVNQVLEDREKSNVIICTTILLPILVDLISYINCGEINKKRKIDSWKKHLESINNKPSENMDSVLETFVDEECDILINLFIEKGLLAIDGYQYLLDSYLADELFNKAKEDKSVIQKMIDVTNNLSELTIGDILSSFDLNNTIQENNSAKKKYL